MPFPTVRRAFTKEDVENLPDDLEGVYGIFGNLICVYVGKGNLRDRLLRHLNGDNPCISKRRPNLWTAEVWDDEEKRDKREKELILEYDSECNKRVG